MLNHCPHFKIFTSRSGERKPDDHNLGTKTSLENNYLSCGDASHIPFASYTENEDTRAARPLSDIELMEKKKKRKRPSDSCVIAALPLHRVSKLHFLAV